MIAPHQDVVPHIDGRLHLSALLGNMFDRLDDIDLKRLSIEAAVYGSASF